MKQDLYSHVLQIKTIKTMLRYHDRPFEFRHAAEATIGQAIPTCSNLSLLDNCIKVTKAGHRPKYYMISTNGLQTCDNNNGGFGYW